MMSMNQISEKVFEVISSNEFKVKIESLNSNFSNLKQEIVIRDEILKLFNKNNDVLRSFAEVVDTEFTPNEKSKRSRIDLLIKNKNKLDFNYKVEIKFFFNKDVKNGRKSSFIKNVDIKKCDLLIIIVQEFDIELRERFLNEWGISDNLSKYQYKKLEENRFNNLIKNFEDRKDGQFLLLEDITIDKPYPTTYKFFCLSKL